MVRVSGGDRPKLSSQTAHRRPGSLPARLPLAADIPTRRSGSWLRTKRLEEALGYGQSDAVATPAAAELQPKAEGYMAATRETGNGPPARDLAEYQMPNVTRREAPVVSRR